MFCDVDPEAVIQNLTAASIYQVPMLMEEQGMDSIVLKKLDMPDKPKDMTYWHEMVERILKHYDRKVTIAVVGKYVELQDAYISITEALKHAAVANESELKIKWVNAENIEAPETDMQKIMEGVDGILVPGGFGDRGIEGKSKLCSMPVRTRSRSLVSVWVCSVLLSNMLVMSAVWKMLTVPNL